MTTTPNVRSGRASSSHRDVDATTSTTVASPPATATCIALTRRARAAIDERLVPWLHRVGPPLAHRIAPVLAIMLLFLAMGGSWRLAGASPPPLAATPATPASPASPSSNRSASAPPGVQARAPVKADSSPGEARPGGRTPKKPASALAGKLNLNTATEEQLVLLPSIGPAKAERIVAWRTKNGGFRRTADLRRVKGVGYKTFRRLEPFLEVAGETTLH